MKDGHGICNGYEPSGSFTCTCNPGFELDLITKKLCVGWSRTHLVV